MWTEYNLDKKAVEGLFGDAPPELEDLLPHRLIVTAGGRVDLYLNFISMPPSIPHRWKECGYELLQVHLSLGYVTNLVLCDLFPPRCCAVELTAKDLKITDDVGIILFSCAYEELVVSFLPSEMRQTAAAHFQNPLIG